MRRFKTPPETVRASFGGGYVPEMTVQATVDSELFPLQHFTTLAMQEPLIALRSKVVDAQFL